MSSHNNNNNNNRRSSFSSSTTSSMAKRHPPVTENVAGKVLASAKKRPPLTNLTNHNASRNSSTLVTKVAKTKKEPSISGNKKPTFSNVKSATVVFPKAISTTTTSASSSFSERNEAVFPLVSTTFNVPVVSSCMDLSSPSKSDGMSVSMDETMSSCDSFKSPDIEYVDNSDVPAVDSIERKTYCSLNISDSDYPTGNVCSRDILVELEKGEKIIDIDDDHVDPQLCASFACDIYKHLRASEVKKRPSTNFMEKIQKDINPSMRAILIDWLVEVAEEYRLVPDTLYLTVNYIDRYLSGNAMNRQQLQLLGVASMMIASKYEEICAPQVEEFCYITDNTYFKEEVLQMESTVLNFLKFEMTAPTIKCFLRRFVRAAQGIDEVPSLQLECLTNYIAELSLLEYSMLCYAPSLIAASSIFLAKFMLFPSTKPWNSTLQHYTQYQTSDLCACVKDLHRLCCNSPNSNLPAIKEKYNQHKYKYVAKKYCPSSIPQEFFQN
ncbi:cyclin-A1-1 [Lathyrus oleraceus]|nr:cyclin-A1-1 [Pisum sativum]